MIARSFLSAAACSLIAACVYAQGTPQTSAPKTPPVQGAKPAAEPAKPAREPGVYATITTSMGTIVAKLFDTEAPKTVRNIADLAMGRKEWTDPKTRTRVKRPLYNGLTFHRVIPGFMIQGGDPLGNGTGGTDVIPDEIAPSLQFDRPGRLGMANAGPGTGSCQFFITEAPTSHLDGKHTIFGQVIEGQDVVENIARVPRGPNDKPVTPVRIVRMTVRREGPAPAPAKPAAAKPKPTTTTPKPAAPKPKPAPAK